MKVSNDTLRAEIDRLAKELDTALASLREAHAPIAMRLHCPSCNELHIDEGVHAFKPHHTHACQKCGLIWRPAVAHTVGVRFLPGFKNL